MNPLQMSAEFTTTADSPHIRRVCVFDVTAAADYAGPLISSVAGRLWYGTFLAEVWLRTAGVDMRKTRSGFGSVVRIGLVTSGAILISSASLAGSFSTSVQYYVNVQPIQVCPDSDFEHCAPVSEPNSPSSVVGFIDPSSADITRAILNQAGIDVNFLGVQRYPSSPDPSLPFNTLNLMKGNVAGQLMSPDLQGLTFQNQIAQGTPPNPNPFSCRSARIPTRSTWHL
jgi:hypothetical protein